MIEDVSNRIKDIVNGQSYTPKQRLFKSREQSTEKEESVKSKKHFQYPPKTPEIKMRRKETEFSQKQQIHPSQENITFMGDLRQKILSIIEPLLYEMEKRILQKLVNLQSRYLHTSQVIHEMHRSRDQFQINSSFGREQEPIKTQEGIEQAYKLVQPLEKQNKHLENEVRTLRENLNAKLREIEFEGKKKTKCKCQRLVEEILRTQSHLMMELKYIKHFRGKSENIQ